MIYTRYCIFKLKVHDVFFSLKCAVFLSLLLYFCLDWHTTDKFPNLNYALFWIKDLNFDKVMRGNMWYSPFTAFYFKLKTPNPYHQKRRSFILSKKSSNWTTKRHSTSASSFKTRSTHSLNAYFVICVCELHVLKLNRSRDTETGQKNKLVWVMPTLTAIIHVKVKTQVKLRL